MIKLIKKWIRGYSSKEELAMELSEITHRIGVVGKAIDSSVNWPTTAIWAQNKVAQDPSDLRIYSDYSSTVTIHTVKGGGFILEFNGLRSWNSDMKNQVQPSKELHYAKDMDDLGGVISTAVMMQHLQK
jgi:hypothetical protein